MYIHQGIHVFETEINIPVLPVVEDVVDVI